VRRRLVIAFIALVSMVVIAFVVPLAVVVRSVARDRAVDDAEAAAQSAFPSIAAARATPALAAQLEALAATTGGEVTFHPADGSPLGAARPAGAWLEAARRGRASVEDADEGVDIVVPIVTGAGSADVLVAPPRPRTAPGRDGGVAAARRRRPRPARRGRRRR
jgi:hypothetical protein